LARGRPIDEKAGVKAPLRLIPSTPAQHCADAHWFNAVPAEYRRTGQAQRLRPLVRPGEFLLGSWTLSKTEPTPCFSGHQVEELSLTLPPGRDAELLPRGKTIENAYLRYQSDWNRDGQVVTVRREIIVRLPVAVCRDEIRVKIAEAIAQIRGDYRSEIALKPLVQ
jgi:hypothetical protein